MIPTALIKLDTLPLTPNGKIDTHALPPPDHHHSPYHPPTTPTEEILADIYAHILGLPRVSIDDSFFTLGGDSLTAMASSPRSTSALTPTSRSATCSTRRPYEG